MDYYSITDLEGWNNELADPWRTVYLQLPTTDRAQVREIPPA